MSGEHREMTINTIVPNKAARGTKRLCQACETRFYDLGRKEIVCPSCGAHYTAVAPAIVTPEARPASFTNKAAWRSKAIKRPQPALPTESQELDAPAISQDAGEEAAGTIPEDDLVLEQDADDADVTGIIDHDVEEPKEG
jgi:uncharacterized protein (TIGR02300 family)